MHPVCASEVEAQTMRMCAVVNVKCHGVWKNATLQQLGDGGVHCYDEWLAAPPEKSKDFMRQYPAHLLISAPDPDRGKRKR